MFEDYIFGDMVNIQKRLTQYRENQRGVKHFCRLIPVRPMPGQPIGLKLTTSGPSAFDAALCLFTTDDTDPAVTPTDMVELRSNGVTWDPIEWGYVQHWTGMVPPQPAGTMVRYHLAARLAGSDQLIFADNQARTVTEATDFALWVENDLEPPAWTREAVVYHIFLDRFYPGDGKKWLKPQDLSGFFGGTLRGVIQKLDYLQSLGFTALWLSPLFASPSHHRYNATDYYTVEPRLGTNADLKELIGAAHACEMRILLDFVANHWSKSHPTFQSAQRDQKSPYHDWYLWKCWPNEYETYFGVKELPKLNLKPGLARDYLLECAQYWLNEGVDGYRLDYALGPPQDFWVDFQRACRSVNSDCWLFGEVIDSAPVQLSYFTCMDGTLDFLLNQALRETFAHGTWSLADFESFLSAHETFFPPSFSRPAFLDNHDMDRILYATEGNKSKVKLAALVLFTLSGNPIVYYGTEVGLTQEKPIHQEGSYGIYEEARLPMIWDLEQNTDLLTYFSKLIWLRRNHPVLQRGTRQLVHLDVETGTYAYLRQSGQDQVLVAINLSDAPCPLNIIIPGFTTEAKDNLGGAEVCVEGDIMEVHLPANCGAFIS